jgi:aspartate racemase
VIGIQSPEIAGLSLPSTLEEMAETYMDAIRKFQPAGPYHFIGHSMGGMLAYQCAVICDRRGDAVGFAGTLDGWNRAADNPSRSEKVIRLVKYFWSLRLGEKVGFVAEKMAWLRSEGSRRKEMSSFETAETTELETIKRNNVRLARQYVAPPWAGVFHVFRARERSATENPDPSLGWVGAAKTVIPIEVPGNHYTLLSPPNVDTLERRLKEALIASKT